MSHSSTDDELVAHWCHCTYEHDCYRGLSAGRIRLKLKCELSQVGQKGVQNALNHDTAHRVNVIEGVEFRLCLSTFTKMDCC